MIEIGGETANDFSNFTGIEAWERGISARFRRIAPIADALIPPPLVTCPLDSPHCCEIQVRTLFEEIWGEVDHALNYPTPTDNVACREQLRVLTKVVGAGSRLVDAIFRTAASAPTE